MDVFSLPFVLFWPFFADYVLSGRPKILSNQFDAVLLRSESQTLAEEADEIGHIIEPHLVGNLLHRQVGGQQQALCMLHLFAQDILQGCDAHRLSEIPYEIRLCKAGLVCKFLYRDGF